MNLRELRDVRSLSQSEVAKFCGVTSSAVSKWEDGSSSPNRPNIRKLAELYNLSFEEIGEAVRKSGGKPD